MTPPSWASVLPATGPAVCVTDMAEVRVNGREITLYRLSSGRVVVDADLLPELRGLMETSS